MSSCSTVSTSSQRTHHWPEEFVYGNVLIGKHEFAAIIGIRWISCAVDIRISKRVQAVASLWGNGDTDGELRKKYREESANKMFALASKLLKADCTRELQEASGVLLPRAGKRLWIVETKAKQVEKRKRAHEGKSGFSASQHRQNSDHWRVMTMSGAMVYKGKEQWMAVPLENHVQEGSALDGFNSDTVDANQPGDTSKATGSDWLVAEEDDEDDEDEIRDDE